MSTSGAHNLVFAGVYYDGASSYEHPARAELQGGELRLVVSQPDGGEACLTFAGDQVRVGSRLGNTPRALALPGGAKFETRDNAAVDELERLWGGGGLRPHLFESSWTIVLTGLVLLVVSCAAGYRWGIPFAAKYIAESMPDEVAFEMGDGALETLDMILFEPSQLSDGRRQELEAGFAAMAKAYPRLPLRLVFRKCGLPNAFALPNGTVVLTDELTEVVEGDDEIYAVLAHEIGHVEHRHTARLAIESSTVGLIVSVLLGDASQMAGIAASVPAVYANASFSREHEEEADTFALHYMQRFGLDPEAFARALEHLSKASGEAHSDMTEYLSSHPATSARIARFRNRPGD